MSEYRAYNGKIDYDVDMWSNGDMYKNQYDTQRVYTDYIISSNTKNSYAVRDTTIDDQFEEQTQTIERYITAMEQIDDQTDLQTEQFTQTEQYTQQVAQTQQAAQAEQYTQQVAQTQQAAQAEQYTQQVAQTQQTAQQYANTVQNLYDEQVDQAFNDIEVLT